MTLYHFHFLFLRLYLVYDFNNNNRNMWVSEQRTLGAKCSIVHTCNVYVVIWQYLFCLVHSVSARLPTDLRPLPRTSWPCDTLFRSRPELICACACPTMRHDGAGRRHHRSAANVPWVPPYFRLPWWYDRRHNGHVIVQHAKTTLDVGPIPHYSLHPQILKGMQNEA